MVHPKILRSPGVIPSPENAFQLLATSTPVNIPQTTESTSVLILMILDDSYSPRRVVPFFPQMTTKRSLFETINMALFNDKPREGGNHQIARA
jgi:hypothetical protein